MSAELLNILKIIMFLIAIFCVVLFFIFAKQDMFFSEDKPKKERNTDCYYTKKKETEETIKRRKHRIQLVEKARKDKIKRMTEFKPAANDSRTSEQSEIDVLRAAWKREKEKREAFKSEQERKEKQTYL